MKILNRWTSEVLYEDSSETRRDTVDAAVRAGANLQDANLQGANLRDADLQGASLQYANLRDANLQGASLQDANLQGANLRDADLQYASLRDANLRDANLQGANLRDAGGVLCLPVGDPRGWRPVAIWHGDHWRVYSGCRDYTIADARKHWGPKYTGDRSTGDQYLAGLDWLEKQEVER